MQLFQIPAKNLRPFEVRLLERNETEDELQNRVVLVIDKHDAVAGQIIIELEHVGLAKSVPELGRKEQVCLVDHLLLVVLISVKGVDK